MLTPLLVCVDDDRWLGLRDMREAVNEWDMVDVSPLQ